MLFRSSENLARRDVDEERYQAVDGRPLDEGSPAGRLDPEDDALLLTSGSAVYGPRHRDYAYSATKPACTLEPPSTNSIRNNTMVGAVAGTPGTLPTNWGGSLATVNGIAINVVGSGYEAGIPYAALAIGDGSRVLMTTIELAAETIAALVDVPGQSRSSAGTNVA